jgi:hypothetical protein
LRATAKKAKAVRESAEELYESAVHAGPSGIHERLRSEQSINGKNNVMQGVAMKNAVGEQQKMFE